MLHEKLSSTQWSNKLQRVSMNQPAWSSWLQREKDTSIHDETATPNVSSSTAPRRRPQSAGPTLIRSLRQQQTSVCKSHGDGSVSSLSGAAVSPQRFEVPIPEDMLSFKQDEEAAAGHALMHDSIKSAAVVREVSGGCGGDSAICRPSSAPLSLDQVIAMCRECLDPSFAAGGSGTANSSGSGGGSRKPSFAATALCENNASNINSHSASFLEKGLRALAVLEALAGFLLTSSGGGGDEVEKLTAAISDIQKDLTKNETGGTPLSLGALLRSIFTATSRAVFVSAIPFLTGCEHPLPPSTTASTTAKKTSPPPPTSTLDTSAVAANTDTHTIDTPTAVPPAAASAVPLSAPSRSNSVLHQPASTNITSVLPPLPSLSAWVERRLRAYHRHGAPFAELVNVDLAWGSSNAVSGTANESGGSVGGGQKPPSRPGSRPTSATPTADRQKKGNPTAGMAATDISSTATRRSSSFYNPNNATNNSSTQAVLAARRVEGAGATRQSGLAMLSDDVRFAESADALMHFRRARRTMGTHFRVWRQWSRVMLNLRCVAIAKGKEKARSRLRVVFDAWRLVLLQDRHNQHVLDMGALRRTQASAVEDRIAAEQSLHEAQASLSAALKQSIVVERARRSADTTLDGFVSPMVFDFRHPVLDLQGRPIDAGFISFTVASRTARGGGQQGGEWWRGDFGCPSAPAGVTLPGREQQPSHYHIRVLPATASTFPPSSSAGNVSEELCTWANTTTAAFAALVGSTASIEAQTGGGGSVGIGDSTGLAAAYRRFVAFRLQKREEWSATALSMRRTKTSNVCLFEEEPRPKFALARPGEVVAVPGVYAALLPDASRRRLLSAALNNNGGGAGNGNLIDGGASPHSPDSLASPPSSGGLHIAAVFEELQRLGMLQQVSRHDFCTDNDAVHALVFARLRALQLISRTADDLAGLRARMALAVPPPPLVSLQSTTTSNGAPSSVASSSLPPDPMTSFLVPSTTAPHAHHRRQPDAAASAASAATALLFRGHLVGGGEGDAAATVSTTPPAMMGPGGVARYGTQTPLVDLVEQRSGPYHCEDSERFPVLAWVREVLRDTSVLKTSLLFLGGSGRGSDDDDLPLPVPRRGGDAADSDTLLSVQPNPTIHVFLESSSRNARSAGGDGSGSAAAGAVGSPSFGTFSDGGATAASGTIPDAWLHVSNFAEDFGDGLELLATIVQALRPVGARGHLPTLVLAAATPADGAKLLIDVATVELGCRMPAIVVQELHTASSVVRALFTTALFIAVTADGHGSAEGGVGPRSLSLALDGCGGGGGATSRQMSRSVSRSSSPQGRPRELSALAASTLLGATLRPLGSPTAAARGANRREALLARAPPHMRWLALYGPHAALPLAPFAAVDAARVSAIVRSADEWGRLKRILQGLSPVWFSLFVGAACRFPAPVPHMHDHPPDTTHAILRRMQRDEPSGTTGMSNNNTLSNSPQAAPPPGVLCWSAETLLEVDRLLRPPLGMVPDPSEGSGPPLPSHLADIYALARDVQVLRAFRDTVSPLSTAATIREAFQLTQQIAAVAVSALHLASSSSATEACGHVSANAASTVQAPVAARPLSAGAAGAARATGIDGGASHTTTTTAAGRGDIRFTAVVMGSEGSCGYGYGGGGGCEDGSMFSSTPSSPQHEPLGGRGAERLQLAGPAAVLIAMRDELLAQLRAATARVPFANFLELLLRYWLLVGDVHDALARVASQQPQPPPQQQSSAAAPSSTSASPTKGGVVGLHAPSTGAAPSNALLTFEQWQATSSGRLEAVVQTLAGTHVARAAVGLSGGGAMAAGGPSHPCPPLPSLGLCLAHCPLTQHTMFEELKTTSSTVETDRRRSDADSGTRRGSSPRRESNANAANVPIHLPDGSSLSPSWASLLGRAFADTAASQSTHRPLLPLVDLATTRGSWYGTAHHQQHNQQPGGASESSATAASGSAKKGSSPPSMKHNGGGSSDGGSPSGLSVRAAAVGSSPVVAVVQRHLLFITRLFAAFSMWLPGSRALLLDGRVMPWSGFAALCDAAGLMAGGAGVPPHAFTSSGPNDSPSVVGGGGGARRRSLSSSALKTAEGLLLRRTASSSSSSMRRRASTVGASPQQHTRGNPSREGAAGARRRLSAAIDASRVSTSASFGGAGGGNVKRTGSAAARRRRSSFMAGGGRDPLSLPSPASGALSRVASGTSNEYGDDDHRLDDPLSDRSQPPHVPLPLPRAALSGFFGTALWLERSRCVAPDAAWAGLVVAQSQTASSGQQQQQRTSANSPKKSPEAPKRAKNTHFASGGGGAAERSPLGPLAVLCTQRPAVEALEAALDHCGAVEAGLLHSPHNHTRRRRGISIVSSSSGGGDDDDDDDDGRDTNSDDSGEDGAASEEERGRLRPTRKGGAARHRRILLSYVGALLLKGDQRGGGQGQGRGGGRLATGAEVLLATAPVVEVPLALSPDDVAKATALARQIQQQQQQHLRSCSLSLAGFVDALVALADAAVPITGLPLCARLELLLSAVALRMPVLGQ